MSGLRNVNRPDTLLEESKVIYNGILNIDRTNKLLRADQDHRKRERDLTNRIGMLEIVNTELKDTIRKHEAKQESKQDGSVYIGGVPLPKQSGSRVKHKTDEDYKIDDHPTGKPKPARVHALIGFPIESGDSAAPPSRFHSGGVVNGPMPQLVNSGEWLALPGDFSIMPNVTIKLHPLSWLAEMGPSAAAMAPGYKPKAKLQIEVDDPCGDDVAEDV